VEAADRRKRPIVPVTAGTFTGPEIRGKLSLAPAPLFYVQSRSSRHGPTEVLARLARVRTSTPTEYTFRAATQIETTAPELDWLNNGIFISVAGRQAAGVTYETFIVG
jgi:Protein of unknown function (DUF3237)